MKNDFTKTNLFSCPIYKIRIDPNSYDKEEILKDIKYNKSLKTTRNSNSSFSHCDIHHSYNDYDNVNFRPINYEKLIVVYRENFQRFFDKEIVTVKKFEWEFTIENYTAVTEGQWLPTHNHMKFDDFAVVHYLNFKDDHVQTLFKNPANFAPFLHWIRPNAFHILNCLVDYQYMLQDFSMHCEEDDMIIFPAALFHEITPQGPTKEPRITISTNMKII